MTTKCTKRIPVAILVRVSMSRMDHQRQISELEEYAASNHYEVVEVLKEKISGRAEADQRLGLQRAEELARTGKIKKVLVHEVSRIARRPSIAHKFVETLEEFGVSLYWHSQRIETLLPNGKRNPASSVLMAVMAEWARAEVETLRERIISGLSQAVRSGVVLGRRKGSSIPPAKLLQKHSDIVRKLRDGHSIRNTAAITGKGFGTVVRVRNIWIKTPENHSATA